jgi:hypothetical protein
MSAPKKAAIPSDAWLAVWRKAHTALAVYCHTRDAAQLAVCRAHVVTMRRLDAAATARELPLLVDQLRPEWDPASRVDVEGPQPAKPTDYTPTTGPNLHAYGPRVPKKSAKRAAKKGGGK